MLLHSNVHWGSTDETYGIGRDEEGPSCLPTDKNSCQEVTQTAFVSPKLLGCDPGSVSGGVKRTGMCVRPAPWCWSDGRHRLRSEKAVGLLSSAF